jgi:chemotaxis protein CheY-P-specific phosphatase CheC
MKAQQRIDKILESVTKKIQEEVTSLIGAVLTLSESENTLISKEDFFDQPLGKQIVAKLDITGSVEGSGCLLVGLKDAIRLGGTLIMLPLQELEKVISSEEYNEETKDSFGEIANIIAGSYTKVFEEMYPDPCRFIRKEQEILIPLKVDIESAEPVPNQLLYRNTSSMKLDDVEMGDLTVLLPAAAFGLEKKEESKPAEDKTRSRRAEGSDEKTILSSGDTGVDQEDRGLQDKKPVVATFDVDKHRKRVDVLLQGCQTKIQEEVSALLGVDVQLSGLENRPVTKEDYFLGEASGKQVLAHMKVTGEVEDKSYLFIGVKDAIRIGGTMIMLPPFELEAAVTEEEFTEDAADAYGEIANIIAGVYTGFFEEQYVKSLRFVKTELEQVVPMKVETAADEPLPDQTYYMSSSTVAIDGKALGKVQMLFPITLLQLEGLGQAQESEEDGVRKGPALSAQKGTSQSPGSLAENGDYQEKRDVDILLISDDEREAVKISLVLEQSDFSVKTLSFKNNVNNYISNSLKAVFLVMQEVDEQAFGVAIKISSSCSVPLIAAGPAWTRSKVIKAVKYGVNDILLTPASEKDIQEKIDNNMVKLAA